MKKGKNKKIIRNKGLHREEERRRGKAVRELFRYMGECHKYEDEIKKGKKPKKKPKTSLNFYSIKGNKVTYYKGENKSKEDKNK